MQMVVERVGLARVFQYGSYRNVLYTIGTASIRPIHWYLGRCDSTKPRGATPKDANGVTRLGGARVTQFWSYYKVPKTIGTSSMGRIQWYKERCDSIKPLGTRAINVIVGGKAIRGAGFSVLMLYQCTLYHWNQLDEANT